MRKRPNVGKNRKPARLAGGPVGSAASNGPASGRGAAGTDRPIGAPPPIRVLLISNLLLVRAGLRRILEDAGIVSAGEASSCAEGVALANRERPDVVLLDLDCLPDIAACVDSLAGGSGRRVIALSDRRDAEHHGRFVDQGALGLVLKHEPPAVLVKAIAKVNAGEAWIDRLSTGEALARMARRRYQDHAEARKIASLTRREREVIALVGEGLQNAAVAERLAISESTARNHITSILDKLGVAGRFELAVYAFRHGLVRAP
jgi:two-component system nitrate/nitrite response regulator NarL